MSHARLGHRTSATCRQAESNAVQRGAATQTSLLCHVSLLPVIPRFGCRTANAASAIAGLKLHFDVNVKTTSFYRFLALIALSHTWRAHL